MAHDGEVRRAAAHLSNSLKSSLECEPRVLSTNNELGHRDPFQAFLPFCLPPSSLSLSFSSTHHRVQVLTAGDGRAHGNQGQLLLALSQDGNEVNLLQLKEINVSLPAKIVREREGQGSWAGLALGRVGLPDFPSGPLQSPRETKVHSGAANVS